MKQHLLLTCYKQVLIGHQDALFFVNISD